MKFGSREVLDVAIFDENNRLVTVLDSLSKSGIEITDDGIGYLVIKDALFDEKLLEFIGRKHKDNVSDYDNFLNKRNKVNTIIFNKNIEKNCRVIAKGIIRKSEDQTDVNITYEIPSATTANNIKLLEANGYEPSEFDLLIKIYQYNNDGDLFKMHIEK